MWEITVMRYSEILKVHVLKSSDQIFIENRQLLRLCFPIL